ncbi:beta-1,4-N-acetylgalactosaminyltransferase 3-like [Astyanax mexicanus]|uniref:Beta-1,4-N-acetylgalactosaminyltransferase n=1 Tax=Astyanax mexicanus TaxID=7994 RepID=A0A8T2M7A4_ASTMX|nr:beta-1,4-N-acetylgalactosaminyltransferase 3-like [Astyanax mexicanus]
MTQVLSSFTGFFSFRGLKAVVLMLVVSVLVLVIYLSFFTVRMEHKTLRDTVLRRRQQMQSSLEEELSFEEKTIEHKQQPWKPEYLGQVNLHAWEDWCGISVNQLRKNVLFPVFPHTRTTINRLATYPRWNNYGLRIFGYIHPASSGQYIFAISSDKNSEFWLSLNEEPQNIRLVAYVGRSGTEWSNPGEYGKFASQKSLPVMLLKENRYFFEVLYKHSEGGLDHLEVAWRLNQRNSTFAVITSEYLSLYVNESLLLVEETDHIPQTIASHEMKAELIPKQPFPVVDMVREDPRDSIYNIPLLNHSTLKNVFTECDYKPLNIFGGDKIQRFHGIYYVHYSAVYPNDYTRQTHTDSDEMCFYNKDSQFSSGGGSLQYLKIEDPPTGEGGEKVEKPDPYWERPVNVNPIDFHSKQTTVVTKVCKRAGNVIMDEEEVMDVVEAFMNKLQTAESTSDLVLKRVLNVERRVDGEAGTRYLLELELEDEEGDTRLMSQHFFVNPQKEENLESQGLMSLCHIKDFSWDPTVRVNVILTVKNQGRWIIQFIRQMEKIYKATGDENFNVIIIDYSSSDVNIQKALKKAKLSSYQYKRLEGTFLKTTAIQTAIDLINDENSILFMCDLHLNFPTNIIDSVRKHTIQGKMIFAPAVMRLDCGASLLAPTGFWEIDGYGLIGIYKSDMDRIGGMNTKDFKDKWGGEDWELLDRILEGKLEVERLNLRNFVHYFHTKRGMWNN